MSTELCIAFILALFALFTFALTCLRQHRHRKTADFTIRALRSEMRARFVAERMLEHTQRWLNSAESACAWHEREKEKLKREKEKLKCSVTKLRWRVSYPRCSNVADEMFNAEFVDEIGEFGKICEPSESVKQYALREWRKDPRNFKKYCDRRVFAWAFQHSSRSSWGKYLAHEREIREKAGVTAP